MCIRDSINAEYMGTESLNFVIKELLDSMKVSISFSEILKRVTAKYGELEIESFKRMFTSMLFGYFYQEKILATVIEILGHNIVTQFLDLTRSRSKGFKVGNSLCAKCSRPINPKSDAEVVTFFCGHVYHSECVQSRSVCYYCTYKDVKAFNIDQLMKKISKKEDKLDLLRAVSYTHLTLPTILLVQISVVAVSLKKKKKTKKSTLR
eukprot:TRINITY_DN18534_c0_g2_i1.p1 TRINITY_DN18534_c0_g2~~TRINITY_DN18534_c0_g2_i1.p1  ORF type:complete len:207 (+),score=44.52 TRINITY_DN18534_c0_g2_i1:98-718(+)